MKALFERLLPGCLVLLLLAAGCGGGSGGQPPSPSPTAQWATDSGDLADRLRAASLTLEAMGPTDDSLFSVSGTTYRVTGGDLQTYQYPDAASAEAVAARISPDGTKVEAAANDGRVATDVLWIATPHFYRSGRILVLYLGSDVAVLRALEAALSPQFAGG